MYLHDQRHCDIYSKSNIECLLKIKFKFLFSTHDYRADHGILIAPLQPVAARPPPGRPVNGIAYRTTMGKQPTSCRNARGNWICAQNHYHQSSHIITAGIVVVWSKLRRITVAGDRRGCGN